MRSLQLHLAGLLAEEAAVYHVLDTTLIPAAVVRVRACGKGLFAGQATSFGRCASKKTEWVHGFKVGLAITPEGVITAFCLAEACAEERPIGDFLIRRDGHDAYLADNKGFSSLAWERRWLLGKHGALWWRPLPKTTPKGLLGRGLLGYGRRESARSSRGS